MLEDNEIIYLWEERVRLFKSGTGKTLQLPGECWDVREEVAALLDAVSSAESYDAVHAHNFLFLNFIPKARTVRDVAMCTTRTFVSYRYEDVDKTVRGLIAGRPDHFRGRGLSCRVLAVTVFARLYDLLGRNH